MRIRRLRPLLLPAITFVVVSFRAEGSSSLSELWKQQLAEIEQALRTREYAIAADACSDLAGDLLEKLGSGRASDRSLALISAYRAIAATGQGDTDEGLWYWRTAQILYPEIIDLDLDQFGPIPSQLKSIPFRGRFQDKLPSENAKIEEPKLRRHPRAVYPQGMAYLKLEARYRVEFVVDVDGSVVEPVLLSKGVEPSSVYAMLDALRRWKFKPGLADGKPIPFLWTQELIFDIRG